MSRVYTLVNQWQEKIAPNTATEKDFTDVAVKISNLTNQAIERVTSSIDRFHFNTAISALMEFVNGLIAIEVNSIKNQSSEAFAMHKALEVLGLLIAPFAPHLAEEVWQTLGHKECILQSNVSWPTPIITGDEGKPVTIPVQVNGRFCTKIEVAKDATEEEIKALVLNNEIVKLKVGAQEVVKVIVIPRQIVNVVVGKE